MSSLKVLLGQKQYLKLSRGFMGAFECGFGCGGTLTALPGLSSL